MIHRYIHLSAFFAVFCAAISFPSWAQLGGGVLTLGSPVTMSFSPTFINRGQSTRLTWSVSDSSISSCRILDVPGVRNVAPNGSLLLSPTENLRALIICDSDFSKTAEAAVVVGDPNEPPSISASFNPSTVFVGQTSRFGWNSSRSTNCSSIGDVNVNNTFGVEFVTPTTDDDLSVTVICDGDSGTSTRTATLTVSPIRPTVSVFASPGLIEQPSTVVVSWISRFATSCSSVDFGNVGVNGSGSIFVSASRVFSVSCIGPGGTMTGIAPITLMPTCPPCPTPQDPQSCPRPASCPGSSDFVLTSPDLLSSDAALPEVEESSLHFDLLALGVKKQGEQVQVMHGDFNQDGFDDIIVVNVQTGIASVLMSDNGEYSKISKEIDGVSTLSQIQGIVIDTEGLIRVQVETVL